MLLVAIKTVAAAYNVLSHGHSPSTLKCWTLKLRLTMLTEIGTRSHFRSLEMLLLRRVNMMSY